MLLLSLYLGRSAPLKVYRVFCSARRYPAADCIAVKRRMDRYPPAPDFQTSLWQMMPAGVGVYTRKEESKKTRKKKKNKNSTKKVIKRQRKFFLFFSWSLSWSSSCFLSFFSCFLDHFLSRVIVFFLFFLFSWSLSWSSSCFLVFLLSCFLLEIST